MSSYISIYVSFKKKKGKFMIYCTSRSSELYQTLYENLHPQFSGSETIYNEVTELALSNVLTDLRTEYQSYEKRLVEYEKYASNNPDYINDILALKEQIDVYNDTYSKISFLRDMLDEFCSDVDKMYITIG